MARRAERTPDLFPIQHRSLHLNRLQKRSPEASRGANPERIYAAKWKKKNRRREWHGATLLELIMSHDAGMAVPISQRDADVAASVVQWLGTNVGLGFVLECEQAIDAENSRHDDHRRESLIAIRRAAQAKVTIYLTYQPQ